MKASFSVVLAASLALCGCSIFQRSPAWESVVASRAQYGSGSVDAKDSYLEHLHRVLSGAGVEHQLVTYQFHFHNAYREESVETAKAILYRDETTPRNPWWIMDEFHHVPVWLPNAELKAQLGFFTQQTVEVVTVQQYPAAGVERRDARTAPAPHRLVTHTAREKKFRALFAAGTTRTKAERSAKAPVDSDPLTTSVLSEHSAAAGEASDARAAALFRTAHGTQFDPGSSVDRSKMNELRRQLLNRNQRVSLRTQ